MKRIWMSISVMVAALLTPQRVVWSQDASASGSADVSADQKDVLKDRADIQADVTDLTTDRADVTKDRAALRDAREDWRQASQKYGADSPQAKETEANLDKVQADLHKDLGDMTADKKDISKDQKTPPAGKDVVLDEKAMAALRADIGKDVVEVKSDSKLARQDRANLRDAREDYNEAAKKYGADSPQAKAAERALDHAQIVLHEQLGDLKADAKDIAKDRAQLARDRKDVRKNLGHDHDRGHDRGHHADRDHHEDRDRHEDRGDKHMEPPMKAPTPPPAAH